MKIAFLICDYVREEFKAHGEYADMLKALFPADDCDVFYLFEGSFPDDAEGHDAFIVNGSRQSVYDDDLLWTAPLRRLVQLIKVTGKPFIGICFGHQILADALGGKVERVGWSVATHPFEILEKESWMQPYQPNLNLLMMCQDQVVSLPKGAVVLGKTPTCPVGIFRVGRMLGIQAHPDFTPAYIKGLMDSRIDRMGVELVTKGTESLKLDVDSAVMAEWMRRFLEQDRL